MWLGLAFISAFLLGCYDVNKKISLDGNAVIPVLFFNTLISSLIFVPFIFLSFFTDVLDGTMLYVPRVSLETHVTLVGAMLVFGERLNLYQWIGVILSIASFYLLSSSGKKEGIRFTHNKWIIFTVLSILTGAASGLYDKHLMGSLDVMTVQVWFNVYQCLMMLPILLFLWYPRRKSTTPFVWHWNIIFISVFLCVADWIYFYALTFPGSMISIVSMVRRSNVLVTFLAGALFFHEKNLKSKAIDLFLVLLGMIFLYLGTR